MVTLGFYLAVLGGSLIMVGGAGDMIIAGLLPSHEQVIGVDLGPAREGVDRLVAGLLRALGGALVALGMGVVALLWVARSRRIRWPVVIAALMTILGEGINAVQMLVLGSPYYVAPAGFAVLTLLGASLWLAAWARQDGFGPRLSATEAVPGATPKP